MKCYTRTVAEVWQHWQPNAKNALHPMIFTRYEDHERVFAKLTSLDRDAWAENYSAVAKPFEAQARAAEEKGDAAAAKALYLRAYGLYRMARYPTTNSPGKRAAYRRSQEMYLAAARYFPYAFERVEIPFAGRPDEGAKSVGYFVRPERAGCWPLVIMWAGIDTFKEDRTEVWEPIMAAKMALLLIDMPGTGDAPLFVGAYRDDPFAAESAQVQAMVGLYGVYDMAAQWQHDLVARPRDQITEKFLGTAPIDDRRIYFDASPISYVTRANNKTAFLIAYGTEDDTVDVATQSVAFVTALKQTGTFVRTSIVQSAPHYWGSDPIEEQGSFSGFFAPRLKRFLGDRL